MDALLAVVQVLYVLGLASWIGSLAVLLLVLRGRRVRPEDVELLEQARYRGRLVALWSIVALLVILLVDVGANALAASGGDAAAAFSGTALRALLFQSRYGVAAVARWLLLLASLWSIGELSRAPATRPLQAPRPGRHALGIVAPAFRPRPLAATRATWLGINALLALGVILCTALAGPYGVTLPATVVEALHLAATLLWLGGTIALVALVVPFIPLVEQRRRPMAVLSLLNRFTPVALSSAAVLVATGLGEMAYTGSAGARNAGGSSALLTPADIAVVAKTLLLLGIAIVGAYNLLGPRRRLQLLALRARREAGLAAARDRTLRRARRAVIATAALALPALVCGAVADVSPRQTLPDAVGHQPLTVAGHAGSMTVVLHVVPNGRDGSSAAVYLADAAGQPLTGKPVGITVAALGTRGPALPAVTAASLGGGHYQARIPPLLGGRWRIAVAIGHGPAAPKAFFALTVPAAHTSTPAGPSPVARRGRQDWQEVGPVLITHALVVAPSKSALLYEGTIEGVYRSGDGGAHWTDASTGLPEAAREVWSLTFLPDHSLIAATDAGIYRLGDGSRRWRSIGLAGHAIYTLAMHVAGHVILLAGGDGGIYRTDDEGAHWRRIYSTGAAGVTSLAWPALHPNLAAAGVNPGRSGRVTRSILVSDDGGSSWHVQAQGLPEGASIMSVAIAPGARVMYTGTLDAGAFVSRITSTRDQWQARSTGLPANAQVGAFAFDPAHPAALYAATSAGVYESADSGAHWRPFGASLRGDATVATALTFAGGPHPTLYAATAAGLYRRTAEGAGRR